MLAICAIGIVTAVPVLLLVVDIWIVFAHEHGCPWDVNTCASAVFGEQLHCLQYAREHGCPWEEESVFTLPPDDDL